MAVPDDELLEQYMTGDVDVIDVDVIELDDR